jgi:hypothetical protein
MEITANLWLGLQTAASFVNLFYCLIGVFLGTAIGVLPGLGPVATIAMLLPVTFGLPPVSALIMLAGIYYGAQYGGSTTAILVNLRANRRRSSLRWTATRWPATAMPERHLPRQRSVLFSPAPYARCSSPYSRRRLPKSP